MTILNHLLVHLVNVLLEEALDHLPLEFEGSSHQSRLGSPNLRSQCHHLGDLKFLEIGFDSMNIDALQHCL